MGRFRRLTVTAAAWALPQWGAVAPVSAAVPGAQSVPDTVTASVAGAVTGVFEGRKAALPHALLVAETASGLRWVQADEGGRYVIEELRPGVAVLRVRHPGHDALAVEVTLAAGETVRIDFELTRRPVRLDPIAVRVDPHPLDPSPGDMDERSFAPFSELDMQALDLTPGVADPALATAVRALPGNDPASATDVLYLRGSTADMKLVLLDGAPIYAPFHVAGLIPGFEPALLGTAALHRGGAPARYDGGLTHILDLRTRSARRDRLRGSMATDLLSASAALEGPLGARGGFLASARSLHDFGSVPLGADQPYGYSDALLTMDFEPAPGHHIGATGFWNAEAVLLAPRAAAKSAGRPVGGVALPPDATWSNRAASITYDGNAGPVGLRALAAVSDYGASLPLQPTAPPGESPSNPLLATGSDQRARLLAEVEWGGPASRTLVGVSYSHVAATYEARELGGPASTNTDADHAGTAVYIDAARPLAPDVTLRAGIRADLFSGGDLRFAPRARISWAFDPRALLSLAVGRYHQATRTPDVEVERTLSEIAESDPLPSRVLPLARADHVVLSLDQLLAGRVRLGLHGFWKNYAGLASSSDSVDGGESIRSSGLDLRLGSAGENAVIWLGYGLSWFWSTHDLSGYSRDFAGRHLISAGGSSDLWGPLRGEFRVAYGSGLPYTSIRFGLRSDAVESTTDTQETAPRDSPLIQALDDDFLRLDLELYARFSPELGGRNWNLRPFLRLLNALNRRDALFYTFQPWRDDSLTPLAERPFLPVVGVALSF